jgi:3-hydroxyisobutyrate dehydrogenase-like beta-hydroxyacid dehydrogenase
MDIQLGLIGFGEAGSSFAAAAGWGQSARAFDIRPVEYAGVTACASLAEAVSDMPLIISAVTAEAAVDVACETARHIAQGAYFFDLNSVSPDSKKAAATAIEAAGGHYIDTAVMAPVCPQYMAVPLLLAGPQAVAGEALLGKLGFTKMRVVGEEVGRAATIKMLRSVVYKGVEALTAECLLACERAGVTDEVLESFGNDWSENADYRLDRMLVHGLRRAAEMEESVETLRSLGLPPRLTEGTADWQQTLGALSLNPPPVGLKAKLSEILRKIP